MKNIDKIIADWDNGSIVIHPTESLPGLSANPHLGDFFTRISNVKGEARGQKPPLSLVHSLTSAKRFWQPLSQNWETFLSQHWPAHLSVVYGASEYCPPNLISNGQVGLRVSSGLTSGMNALLEKIDSPWPSTSINAAGQQAIADYTQAASFVRKRSQEQGFDFSVIAENDEAGTLKPQCTGASSLLLITGPQSAKWLRQGNWTKQNLDVWQKHDLTIET